VEETLPRSAKLPSVAVAVEFTIKALVHLAVLVEVLVVSKLEQV
jgi:hypothetical protein